MSSEFERDNPISIFIVEASDGMEVLTKILYPPDAQLPAPQQLHEQLIIAHRIRSAAARYGYDGIARLCERLAAIFEQTRAIPTDEWLRAVGVMRETVEGILTLVKTIGGGGSEDPAIVERCLALSAGLLPDESTMPVFEPVGPADSVRAEKTAMETQQPIYSDDYFLPQLDPEVLEYFEPEAQAYLESLEAILLQLDKDARNRDLINQLFRTAHTLKGAAYIVGFQAIGDLVHHVEDFIGAVHDGRISLLPGHTDVILFSVDVVRVLMRRDPSRIHATRKRFETVLWELKQLDQVHAAVAGIGQEGPQSEVLTDQRTDDRQPERNSGDERRVVRVSCARLEKLMNLVGELMVGRSRLERRLHTLERLSDQAVACKTQLVDSIQTFADTYTCPLPVEPTGPSVPLPQAEGRFGDFGGLELNQYGDFNSFARRISEVSADMAESMDQVKRSMCRAHDDMSQLQQLTKNMQDEISRARMVPIGTPFTRFRRAVRESARALHKEVSLVTSGEHTEVDTGIVERLVDPLVHLVRNAVYHGIESPSDRIARGKPASGTIYLRAMHRGGSIVIEVEDDGEGIDLGKIRSKASKIGIVQPDQVQTMPDTDVLQYIFSAGFSTADTVGDQAGRGVGLDVVKQAVEGMNGHIEVESMPGVGTKFILNVPLTVLITTALLVRTGSERYAIALSSIREVTWLTEGSLMRRENQTLMHMGEDLIEVHSLRHILRRESGSVKGAMPVVIVRTAAGVLGLAVDELLGRQEIMIKALGSLKPIARSCFGGATIDSDGQVILVLDPSRLDPRSLVQSGVSAYPAGGSDASEQREEARAAILLIDDSLSSRKCVGKILESAGYSIDTAVDGEDGLRKASGSNHRLIIVDIEMPKLNGYEVVQALRGRLQTRQTPIVMMTVRACDTHRQLALDIGANAYITKPVDERILLQEVEQWVGPAPAIRT